VTNSRLEREFPLCVFDGIEASSQDDNLSLAQCIELRNQVLNEYVDRALEWIAMCSAPYGLVNGVEARSR